MENFEQRIYKGFTIDKIQHPKLQGTYEVHDFKENFIGRFETIKQAKKAISEHPNRSGRRDIRKVKTWAEVKSHPNVMDSWVEEEEYTKESRYCVVLKEGWSLADNPQRSIMENSVKGMVIEINRIKKVNLFT